ncbi:methyltransferase [Kibdelosporangium philippinense]|uniref:Methyltransferase n=1 Tax=Kibdelosporangium philippinense TaxID=211113 RepID=A0ABS8Z716_9PSEU|nr:class I SAM-dependent methyltransferase [Kibdelosporangium philippinense]MCE7003674.1 methyltransferase [Kibdelosporangium philippinense]
MLTLLFPEGAKDETEPIYQSSPIARYYNVLARHVIGRLADTADRGRTLRVLEVGGGTGGLTSAVLPVLPADRCEYVFTDISPAFVQSAVEGYQRYEFVTGRTLDIEGDLAAQGIELGSFDLVLASDVVHATADVKRTLLHLREVLAPGGVLAMMESRIALEALASRTSAISPLPEEPRYLPSYLLRGRISMPVQVKR